MGISPALAHTRKRIKTAKDNRTRRSRELLRYYVLVLANSGLRPGEANNLKLRDVHSFTDEKGRSNYRLFVRGKTGERDAIVRFSWERFRDAAGCNGPPGDPAPV